jgi:hypothetical protein
LENYIGTEDRQCHYTQGRGFYACRTKQGIKARALWGLIGNTGCIMLQPRCRTTQGPYDRVELYISLLLEVGQWKANYLSLYLVAGH